MLRQLLETIFAAAAIGMQGMRHDTIPLPKIIKVRHCLKLHKAHRFADVWWHLVG